MATMSLHRLIITHFRLAIIRHRDKHSVSLIILLILVSFYIITLEILGTLSIVPCIYRRMPLCLVLVSSEVSQWRMGHAQAFGSISKSPSLRVHEKIPTLSLSLRSLNNSSQCGARGIVMLRECEDTPCRRSHTALLPSLYPPSRVCVCVQSLLAHLAQTAAQSWGLMER